MPRQPRLDTPGALHHALGRGTDGLKIFGDRKDCEDFLNRLKVLCESEALSIYVREWGTLRGVTLRCFNI